MAREITLHLIAGEPRVGIWCDTCLTSARYEVDILIMGDDGISPFRTLSRCGNCDDDA